MCRGCDSEAASKAIVAGLTAANAAETVAAYVANELPRQTYPESQFAGRGVVIAAGGVKYGVCAWVCVRALRHVGCQLPIEIWYRGGPERQRGLEQLLAPYNVTWVDAFAVRDAGHPHARLNGWELKPFAVQWSSFAEVLFIDADNVVVTDPTYLFNDPNYLDARTVLWPDYARMAPSREAWDVFGLREYAESIGHAERCVESGQILLDKRRTWQCLCLANWFGERSRFFFRYVYGDKELFHLAWRRLEQPYAMPARGIHTLQGTMCQHDFSGQRVFQHRNFNKWNLTKNNPRPDFWLEPECLGWIEELKQLWSPAADSFATAEDRAAIAGAAGVRYGYYRRGKHERDLVMRADGTFAEGGARCERYWTIRDGRLLVAQQDGQLLMDLEPSEAGSWAGAWRLHEKIPVEIRLKK
jgi:hypothetical protein